MIEKTDIGNRFTGFYRGQIKKHLSHGKCKIYIPGVYDDETQTNIDLLPDAEPATPLFGGGCDGNGCFSYPDIDAIVWCFFANDDINCPVYFASTLGGELAEENFEISSPEGSDGAKITHKIHAHNSDIEIKESGTITIHTHSEADDKHSIITLDDTGKITIKADSIDVTANNSIAINAGGTIDITSAKVNVDSEIVATKDVIGAGISLQHHTHTGNMGSPTSPPNA